ncbi:MAG: DUF2783 domain-containing protein [Caldimonas sp.]
MRTDPNIPDPDGFYEAWIAAHEGLSDAESTDLDARLVMLLANQIGSQEVLLECIAAARAAKGQEAPAPGVGTPA